MTTPAERSRVLEAVERIANRGEPGVPSAALAVVRQLLPEASLGPDGRIDAPEAGPEERALLDRLSLLVSPSSSGERTERFPRQ